MGFRARSRRHISMSLVRRAAQRRGGVVSAEPGGFLKDRGRLRKEIVVTSGRTILEERRLKRAPEFAT